MVSKNKTERQPSPLTYTTVCTRKNDGQTESWFGQHFHDIYLSSNEKYLSTAYFNTALFPNSSRHGKSTSETSNLPLRSAVMCAYFPLNGRTMRLNIPKRASSLASEKKGIDAFPALHWTFFLPLWRSINIYNDWLRQTDSNNVSAF